MLQSRILFNTLLLCSSRKIATQALTKVSPKPLMTPGHVALRVEPIAFSLICPKSKQTFEAMNEELHSGKTSAKIFANHHNALEILCQNNNFEYETHSERKANDLGVTELKPRTEAHDCMIDYVTLQLLAKVPGSRLAYSTSDEFNLLLRTPEDCNCSKIQQLSSMAASLATHYAQFFCQKRNLIFNHLFQCQVFDVTQQVNEYLTQRQRLCQKKELYEQELFRKENSLVAQGDIGRKMGKLYRRLAGELGWAVLPQTPNFQHLDMMLELSSEEQQQQQQEEEKMKSVEEVAV